MVRRVWLSLHEEHRELIVALLPLSVCLCVLSFLLSNAKLRAWPIPARVTRTLAVVAAVGCCASLIYAVYEPPDDVRENLALVQSSARRLHHRDVPCRSAPPNGRRLQLKIVSYADGPHAEALCNVSDRIHARYVAQRSRFMAFYSYRDCQPRVRHAMWAKVALLYQELMDPMPPTWLLFLDADAAVVEHGIDVYHDFLAHLAPEVLLVVAEDIGVPSRPLNTGFMALRSGPGAVELMELVWSQGRRLNLGRRRFHEQDTLAWLLRTGAVPANRVVVLGGAWDAKFRVKMYGEGSLPANRFSDAPFAWHPGDAVAHAIGVRAEPGRFDKLTAMRELEAYVLRTAR